MIVQRFIFTADGQKHKEKEEESRPTVKLVSSPEQMQEHIKLIFTLLVKRVVLQSQR